MKTSRSIRKRNSRISERSRGAGIAGLALAFGFEMRGVRFRAMRIDVIRARLRVTLAAVLTVAGIAAAIAAVQHASRREDSGTCCGPESAAESGRVGGGPCAE